ncbi:IS110 family transposase, partial [Methylorubrum extorquens]
MGSGPRAQRPTALGHHRDETFHVPRDAKGLEALARRFSNLPVALIVLEATGGFEANAAAALAAAGLPLCIVNPRQISDF